MSLKLITGLAATAVLVACATPLPRGKPAAEEIEAVLESAAVTPPPEVAAALAPEVRLDLPEPGPSETRFDVNCNDTPAREFFMGLVEGTPYNLVVHPDVAGTISLTLKNVTVMETLDAIREVYGYEIRGSTGGIVVLPATLQSRIFQIDYLNLQRSGVSRTRVSSGQVSDRSSTQGQAGAGFQSGSNTLASPGVGTVPSGMQQVTGSRIDTNYEADFWTELEDTLASIIGVEDGRQVVINAQTGVIVVRALPQELRSVEDYLKKVQETAQRQVIIEAKIVEVQLNDAFQAGINWIAVQQNSSGDTFTVGQAAPPGELFGGDPSGLGGQPITVQPGSPITGFVNDTLGGALTLAFDIGDFNAFIELLEAQGDTRVLSSPRVSTLNNQKAVIKAGTDEFFVTDVSSNTITGTSSTTSRDVELTPFFSGIALDVTPQISGGDEVILHIHPTVSEVTDQVKDLTVSGETDRLPLAFSEVRESDSVVRARSGQIIVIGGLMRNSSREQDFGVPFLGRVPGIGGLFRSSRDVERKTELVILLKPIVVNSDEAWTEIADESLERIRQFGAQ